jgi:2-succinyl-5-enolpyruvyl-6-hydroxy-3-cyclohexene-1-carboxylate synthase
VSRPAIDQAAVAVDELARGGVTDVVLAPGSRSAPLVLAADHHPRVRVHVRVDERSAGFVALGVSRATGRPAAALCTSGTAAASLHPPVVEADAAGVPLLAVTADRPPELRDAGANQTVDQPRLYGSAARAFGEIAPADAEDAQAVAAWRSEVARLVAAARGVGAALPGPVQLNVALREPLVADDDTAAARVAAAGQGNDGPASNSGPANGAASGAHRGLAGRGEARPWTSARARASLPDDAVIAELARRLAGEPRGLIVAGEGAVPADRGLAPPGWPDDPARGGTAIADLAARLGWPLLAEPTSRARQGACLVDCADGALRSEAFVAAWRPEVILRLGRAVLGRPLGALLANSGAEQVVVTAGGRWHDPPRTAAWLIDGEPDRVAAAVAARLDPPVPTSEADVAAPDEADVAANEDADVGSQEAAAWRAAWHDAGAAARAAIDARLDAGDALGEARLARDLVAALPPGAVLVAGSSRPVRDVDEYAPGRDDVTVMGNRGASGIDGLASTAMGAALGTRRPVVALAGDLSVLHDAAGLAVCGSPQPDLTLVVVDNDGGGIFAQLPPGELPAKRQQRFTTPHGVDLAAMAGAFGIPGVDVAGAGELAPALAAARAAGGLQLVRVATDRHTTAADHANLRAAAVEAVEARLAAGPR